MENVHRGIRQVQNCFHVYLYTFKFTNLFIYVSIHIENVHRGIGQAQLCIYVYRYKCIYIHSSLQMKFCLCVCIYVYIYVFMYSCICVCMHVCTICMHVGS
jgi:hypothetical protein